MKIRHLNPREAALFVKTCRFFAEELASTKKLNFNVSSYLKPITNLSKLTLHEIFVRLLVSAANANMKANVIAFSNCDKPRRNAILKVLFGTDFPADGYLNDHVFKNILNNFTPYKIEEKIVQLNAQNLIKGTGIELWKQWLHTVLDVVDFVQDYSSGENFVAFFKNFHGKTAFLAPLYVQNRIFGLGFALSCDALKELGFDHLVKPDVHNIKVLEELNLSKGGYSISHKQINAYNALIEIVENANEYLKYNGEEEITPYSLDKLIWLCSSGYFYKDNLKTKKNRDELIAKLEESLTH